MADLIERASAINALQYVLDSPNYSKALGEILRIPTADTPQTEEKHAICNGCVYCDLPNAFHPCASCVDFSKYVGEESGDTPQTDCGWGEPVTVSHSKDKED